MNINDYTGLPYDFRRYNCWTHSRAVRNDAGIDTPEFDVVSPAKIADAFDAGHADTKGLQRVCEPRNMDVVLMGYRHGGRIIWHAGVYFDGMVSHCERVSRQVKLESLADIKEKYPETEFWR